MLSNINSIKTLRRQRYFNFFILTLRKKNSDLTPQLYKRLLQNQQFKKFDLFEQSQFLNS